MSARDRRLPRADLDLRIKAGAAFTCDLSTRLGSTGAAGEMDARRTTSFVDLAPRRSADHPWLRRIGYLGFAVAIAIPWILLFADQLPG